MWTYISNNLNNLSINKKMIYLIGLVTIAVFSSTAFVFYAFSDVESRYTALQDNSVE